MPYRHDDHEDLDQREYPDPDEVDSAAETVSCPFCRALVWADADLCPGCGMFLAFEEEARGRPWWFRAAVLLCLGVVLFWIWAGW